MHEESLNQQICSACHDKDAALDSTAITTMMQTLAGWALVQETKAIHKRFTFPDFVQALDFTVRIGAVAEQEGHHPDLALGWGYVDVTLTTHFHQALTRNDFILAAKIDQLPH